MDIFATLSIMDLFATLSIMDLFAILSIRDFFATLSINDFEHNNTQYTSIECHYAECPSYLNVKLSVIMPNVAVLCVTAPLR
jgi:hypothetical protein